MAIRWSGLTEDEKRTRMLALFALFAVVCFVAVVTWFVLGFRAPPSVDTSVGGTGTVLQPSPTTKVTVRPDGRRPDVVDNGGNPIAADPRKYPPVDPRSRLAGAEEVLLYNACLAGRIVGPQCVAVGQRSDSQPPPLPASSPLPLPLPYNPPSSTSALPLPTTTGQVETTVQQTTVETTTQPLPSPTTTEPLPTTTEQPPPSPTTTEPLPTTPTATAGQSAPSSTGTVPTS